MRRWNLPRYCERRSEPVLSESVVRSRVSGPRFQGGVTVSAGVVAVSGHADVSVVTSCAVIATTFEVEVESGPTARHRRNREVKGPFCLYVSVKLGVAAGDGQCLVGDQRPRSLGDEGV